MSNTRLPVAVCSAVADVLNGSHDTLNALFETAGAPGSPPDLAHHSKWKTWLQRVGNDPEIDSLSVLGNLIEEFMDLPPLPSDKTPDDFLGLNTDPLEEYNKQKNRLVNILEEFGFRYFLVVEELSRLVNLNQLGQPQYPRIISRVINHPILKSF